MVACGRVICVALPFVLAVVSIVALLVAALSGVADKHMYMFEVNTTGLSISATDAVDILSTRAVLSGLAARSVGFHDTTLLSEKETSSSSNITASDLGLGNIYDINLWNYCETAQNGTRTCTKPKFDWAAKTLNSSENTLTNIISSTGLNLTIPSDIQDAIKVFSKLAKWTEVVFIIAFVALAVEIAFGLFTSCSRGIACLTFVIAIITVVAVVAAAAMATAMATVVVGAIKGAAGDYGVDASLDTSYLAALWIAAAAAVAASFFWMFTVCCCSPESRIRSRSHSGGNNGPIHMGDKPNAYQPLHDPHQNAGFPPNAYAPQYGQPRYPQGGRSDLAYEPYSHQRN
ncbi:integral membrane protein [Ophiostoma piceae UAMH 11346]|uniref:Integral membrane protein n=1 Tax=Ophiostoma piceae (strain UAMH 11346) TaxID=1262450 RepID=S3CTR8_OPHP1|nr:integral membrane protein [Ophiostoma piceae UAMH 11346]